MNIESFFTRSVQATFLDGDTPRFIVTAETPQDLATAVWDIITHEKPLNGKGNVIYQSQKRLFGLVVVKKENLGDNSEQGLEKAYEFLK